MGCGTSTEAVKGREVEEGKEQKGDGAADARLASAQSSQNAQGTGSTGEGIKAHAEGDEQSATLPPAVQALVDAAGDTPLTVVSASDDERADHDARLNEIRERAGHCLWAENAAG